MSLHFAASRNGKHALLARMLTPPAVVRAANENGRPIGEMLGEPSTLRAALLHFARHGLAAAEHARNAAEAAFAAGDDEQYRHWLALCRILDRRMAKGTMERLESSGSGTALAQVKRSVLELVDGPISGPYQDRTIARR